MPHAQQFTTAFSESGRHTANTPEGTKRLHYPSEEI
jgi:hypothetical protein